MKIPSDKSVDFFVGTEVENTPAKGKLTLFVVGIQPADKIIAKVKKAQD